MARLPSLSMHCFMIRAKPLDILLRAYTKASGCINGHSKGLLGESVSRWIVCITLPKGVVSSPNDLPAELISRRKLFSLAFSSTIPSMRQPCACSASNTRAIAALEAAEAARHARSAFCLFAGGLTKDDDDAGGLAEDEDGGNISNYRTRAGIA